MATNKGTYWQNGKKPNRYPVEIRTQAVEMYRHCRPEFSANDKAARHVADLLGVGHYDSVLA